MMRQGGNGKGLEMETGGTLLGAQASKGQAENKNKEGYVYIQLLHFAIQQKPAQHCKATVMLSVVQSLSCVPLCSSRDCSTPVFPVPHCLLELAHTHVH